MKNLSLFVSAFALCTSTSYAAINCNTLPTCASLGYSDTVSHCPKSVNGEEMVVKCPFDTAQGKCVYEAAVGQIGYFTKAPDAASGWLLCDGTTFTRNKYPELYAFIGQQFCNAYNGGTCGTDVGRLPKYTGLFLRVSGTPTGYGQTGNTDLTTPQKEGLPNITGQITSDMGKDGFTANFDEGGNTTIASSISGAFYSSRRFSNAYARGSDGAGYLIEFSAEESNPVYGASSGVTPPNMAVHAYIYAGKIVSQ